MRIELNRRAYIHDLEQHLQLALFGGGVADAEGAVLLVRGALAGGDQVKAARLAEATRRLAATVPDDPDLPAAADHVRGLIEQDPLLLEQAASCYSSDLACACALEDAGNAWAERGKTGEAEDQLRHAHAIYERLGAADGMARVRSCLRAVGTRIRHWRQADRPVSGWGSLTDTEERIADLVARGLSNRDVADELFLSAHTIAFHLRHIFGKLGVTSRVQLARLAAEHAAQAL